MDSPKRDNENSPQKKEPVMSRRYPTSVGMKKEPRFPKDVINPTALPTRNVFAATPQVLREPTLNRL
jgi:hypothetical protein